MSGEDPFGDPDLVRLYDLDNPGGTDHEFYRGLADALPARRVVDLGCGTGLLTRSLVAPGRTVTGIDPSRIMLDFARSRPGADRVDWVLGDAAALPSDGSVDLLLCTGNAVMQLDDDDFDLACRHAATALRPGGVFAFETRDPAAREWETWTRENTDAERDTVVGHLREWLDVVDVSGERVTFDAHNVFAGTTDRVYRNVLHFRGRAGVEAALTGAGFDVEVRGGWHDEPVTDSSPVLVVRAVAAGGAQPS